MTAPHPASAADVALVEHEMLVSWIRAGGEARAEMVREAILEYDRERAEAAIRSRVGGCSHDRAGENGTAIAIYEHSGGKYLCPDCGETIWRPFL